MFISAVLAWKGAVKIGDDPAAIPAFHTAVLSSSPEQTGVSVSGVAGSELVVVRKPAWEA